MDGDEFMHQLEGKDIKSNKASILIGSGIEETAIEKLTKELQEQSI